MGTENAFLPMVSLMGLVACQIECHYFHAYTETGQEDI